MISRINDIKKFLGITVSIPPELLNPIENAVNVNSVFARVPGRGDQHWQVHEYENKANKQDFTNLLSLLLHYNPQTILEFGNSLGVMSNFILDVLPNATLVSTETLEYTPENIIGYYIDPSNKDRHTQLYLTNTNRKPQGPLIYPYPQLVVINTDTTLDYINYYTSHALKLYKQGNIIIWYGCNSSAEDGRKFLRCYDKINCVSFSDIAAQFHGAGFDENERSELGFALWNEEIEEQIEQHSFFQ
jgi:hypothetical protein